MRIIAFSGKMGSGKTTATNIALNLLMQAEYKPNITKFASGIYDMVYSMCSTVNLEFDKAKLRPLMQYIGEFFRKNYSEDFWADRWKARNQYLLEYFLEREDLSLVVLCDDLRYNNEAEVVRSLGGHIIRVEAKEEDRENRVSIVNPNHESELGINPMYFHQTIYNNGSIEDLNKEVQRVLNVLGYTS